MGTNYELKNRFMHVNYVEEMEKRYVNYGGVDVFNTENEAINKIIEQLSAKFSAIKIKNVEKILMVLNKNSYITYEELVVEVGIGRSTVSRYLKELKELDVLKRVGANKMVRGLFIPIYAELY